MSTAQRKRVTPHLTAVPRDDSLWRVAALSMMDGPALRQKLSGPDALAWIRAAAERGIVEAQLKYAQAQLDGTVLPQDHIAAFTWISRAAATGDAEALNMLGRCYENGWGTTKSFASAAACFRRAADKGHAWAQYNLGHLLLDGLGVVRDRAAAFACYFNAAAQGHIRAMNLVARCFEMGWGVARSCNAARDYYRRSAEGGYFRGHYNYGMVLAGEGSIDDAVTHVRRAVDLAPDPTRSNMLRALRNHPCAELRALASDK